MVISRNEVAYQRVETTSNKASPPDIPQESQLYFHSHANKQHSGFDIYEKMGEIKNPKMITDQDYCGVPINKVTGLESRHKVDSSEWIFCRHVFPNLCQKLGTPTVDLFASRVSDQVAQYAAWKLDPYSIAMDPISLLHISPILSDPPCAKQNTTRPITHSNIGNILLANRVVVPASVGNANKDTNSNNKFNHTFSRSKGESPSISVDQNFYISGMTCFREGLSFQGVFEETTQLTVKSRRQSTLRNYESTWKKWSAWCDSWKFDPF